MTVFDLGKNLEKFNAWDTLILDKAHLDALKAATVQTDEADPLLGVTILSVEDPGTRKCLAMAHASITGKPCAYLEDDKIFVVEMPKLSYFAFDIHRLAVHRRELP